jgi:hypothetical protein
VWSRVPGLNRLRQFCGLPPTPVRYATGCFRLESNQAAAFRRGSGKFPYRKRHSTWARQDLNLHFQGTRLYRPLGYLTAQLAPGAINRDRTGTFRATTWRADRYTMTAVPDEGVEPPLSLCKSDALPLRKPG